MRRIVTLVLKYCKKSSDSNLEIVFLTDKDIRRLNKEFKGSDRATDVLSFDLGGVGDRSGYALTEREGKKHVFGQDAPQ